MTDYTNASYRSDTGLWHLTVRVSDHGVSAWLNLKDSETEPPRMLVDSSWPKERDGLMGRIENAVYDNPDVLDDYAATIIVESARTLVVPATELKEEGDAERLYTMVYKSRNEDVMADESGPETILFTLIPGMISFLRRTFPGARVRSHLGMFIERVRNLGAGLRIFLDIRHGEADIVALNGDTLLSASVQPYSEWTDIVYRIFNLMDVYSLKSGECEISFSGADSDLYRKLSEFLTPKCALVRHLGDDTARKTI